MKKLTTKEKEMIVKDILSSEYLDLRCDWAFKYVMQNLDILKMLLNDFGLMLSMTSGHLEQVSLFSSMSMECLTARFVKLWICSLKKRMRSIRE